jgi:Tape measure protein
MSTVDSKVVEMKFDNKEFATGVKSTIKSLSDLTSSLSKAAANTGLNGLGKAADHVSERFSLMRVAALTAVSTIAAQATRQAEQFVKGFTFGPVMDGFHNYETQIGAVQTILANTGLEGKKGLATVTASLADLNKYANLTVYNFSEMAKNIGTFTAAGVKLGPATSAIKGIANLAALSGSSADQASSAMYQLSQALAAGKVGLQDWNSVVNAGIGGKIFQEALFNTGQALHTIKGTKVNETFDQWTKAGNTFRNSLKSQWVTGKVLSQTLAGFTGDMTDAQLKSEGYTASQIKQIQKIGKTAFLAATQIKTFSQLTQALKEEVATAYAAIFTTIFGNITTATALFSPLHQAIENGLTNPIYAINKVLIHWAKLGGRVRLIDGLHYALKDIKAILVPIQHAFRDIFPRTTGIELYNITNNLEKFFQFAKLGAKPAQNLKHTFEGFFAILDIGRTVIKAAIAFIGKLFAAISEGSAKGGFLAITGHIGDFFVALDKGIKKGQGLTKFFDSLLKFIQPAIDKFHELETFIAGLFTGKSKINTKGVTDKFAPLQTFAQKIIDDWNKIPPVFDKVVGALKNFGDKIQPFVSQVGGKLKEAGDSIKNFFGKIDIEKTIGNIVGGIGNVLSHLGDAFHHVSAAVSAVIKFIKPFGAIIGNAISTASGHLGQLFSNLDYSKVLSTINTGLFAGLVLLVKKFLKGTKKDIGDKSGFLDTIKEPFEKLTGTLKTMQQSLKAAVLLEIAIAVGILAASCVALSLIKPPALTGALKALGGMMGELIGSFVIVSKFGGAPGMIATASGLVIFAGAIDVLTASVVILSKVDIKALKQGLGGLAAILAEVVIAAGFMSKQAPLLISSAAALLVISGAIKVLVGVVIDLGKQDIKTLKQGLKGVGALLGELALFTKFAEVDKGGLLAGAGLFLLALAIAQLVKSVKIFGTLDVKVLRQGLIAIGAILAGFAIFSITAGNPATILAAAASMVVISFALQQMVKPLTAFGNLSWKQIAKGLTVMAVALASIALAIGFLPPDALLSAAAILVVASSLQLIGQAMVVFSGMSWEEIAKGLVAMAGALTIMGVAAALMGNPEVLLGAGAMLIMAAAVKILAPELVLLGGLSWTQIGIGLAALAGAFAVIGVAGLLLTPVIPGILGLGAGILLIGAGVAALGLGVFLFATGLTAIAAAGVGAAAVIVAIGAAVLTLIPQFAAALVNGLDVFINGLAKALPDLLVAVGKILLALIATVAKVAPPLIKTVIHIIGLLLDALASHGPKFFQQMVAILLSLIQAIAAKTPDIVAAIVKMALAIVKGLAYHVKDFVVAGGNIVVNIIKGLTDQVPKIVAAAVAFVVAFCDGLAKQVLILVNAALDLVVTLVNGIADAIRTHTQPMIDAGENLGNAIIEGLLKALKDVGGKVAKAAGNLAKSAYDSAKNFLDINSPSKKFIQLGHSVGEGFAIGITEGSPGVKAAWQQASGLLNQAVQDSRTQIQNYQSDIAKSTTAYKSSADKVDYYTQKIADSGGKHKVAAAQLLKYKQELEAAQKAHADAGAQVAKYTALLEKATQDHTLAKDALAKLNDEHKTENDKLVALAKTYADYSAQLDVAKQKLVDLKQVRDDYNASVTDEFSTLPTIDTNSTADTFNQSLTEQLADLQKFTDVLGQLRALGLDDQTYKLLISSGPQALPFMEDLLSQTQNGTGGGISAIDALDTQIAAAAANLGANASAALYQAGIDAQQKVVDGLTAKMADLSAKMKVISDSIIKGIVDALNGKKSDVSAAGTAIGNTLLAALKKSLGIKSPSKEMAILGAYAAAGVVVGLVGGVKDVTEAASNLGTTATDALKKSISGLAGSFAGVSNLNPTITPILDLSSVKKSAGDINGMLSTKPVLVDDAFLKAQAASLGIQANQAAAAAASSAASVQTQGSSIAFTQNNYSPKALSQVEIYRQTKNQISVAKGALTGNVTQVA